MGRRRRCWRKQSKCHIEIDADASMIYNSIYMQKIIRRSRRRGGLYQVPSLLEIWDEERERERGEEEKEKEKEKEKEEEEQEQEQQEQQEQQEHEQEQEQEE